MRPSLRSVSGLALACSLGAQGTVLPPGLAEQWGSGCNLLPWNSTTMRW